MDKKILKKCIMITYIKEKNKLNSEVDHEVNTGAEQIVAVRKMMMGI